MGVQRLVPHHRLAPIIGRTIVGASWEDFGFRFSRSRRRALAWRHKPPASGERERARRRRQMARLQARAA